MLASAIMRRGFRREAYAVAAALTAHAVLLLASPRPPLSVPGVSPSSQADADLDLDLEPEPEAPRPAVALPVAPEAAEAPAAAPAKGPSAPPGEANAKIAAVAKEPSLEPPAAGSPLGVASPEAPPAPPSPGPAPGPPAAPSRAGVDEYGGPAGGSDVAALPPGLGGARLWSIPGMLPGAAPPKPASTVASGPPPVDTNVAGQVLSGSLSKKDKAIGIGLPAAGAVATTLADAVRSSAPVDARATFEVKLGAGGQVEGVRLLSATAGDAATWARVVASAKGSLGGRALQMSGDGKPATVIVKVESNTQFPAGSKKAVDMQPVCAEEELAKMAQAIQNGLNSDLQRGARPEPGMAAIPADDGPDAERKRRFCIPVGMRGKGDVSNLGAHAVNVVKSSFTVTKPGEKALDPDAVRPIDTRVPWAPEDPTKVRPALPAKKKKKKKY
jgi:hypothetical protein